MISASCSNQTTLVNKDAREREGQCLSCGQQLFRKRQSWKKVFFGSRMALTIPGVCQRGQCLVCSPTDANEGMGTEKKLIAVTQKDVLVQATQKAMDNDSTYEGTCNDYGQPHGKGTMVFANGDRYEGEWFQGRRHGAGSWHFADGTEYVGDFECGFMHGKGTRRYDNGDTYVGSFVDGKREGEGRFYLANGDMFVGSFQDDTMDGVGKYHFASGQVFEGIFWRGMRHGRGKVQRKDGSLEIGGYQNDQPVGPVVRWSANRKKAWVVKEGKIQRKISVLEAVGLVYEIDNVVHGIDRGEPESVFDAP